MARYTGPACRLCRREGTKLFLKGTRCLTEKCAIERRGYAPGQHGQTAGRRRKASEYSKQLREKQKVKRIYGLSERQFRNVFERVLREPGVTGEALLIALESRLDNMVYRMGFAASRRAARQLVRHRHILVNGRPVDVPSFRVRPGDEVRVTDASRELVPGRGPGARGWGAVGPPAARVVDQRGCREGRRQNDRTAYPRCHSDRGPRTIDRR